MPDTVHTHAENLAALADNTNRAITAQKLRDAYVTLAEAFGGGTIVLPGATRGAALNTAIADAYALYLASGRPQLVQLIRGQYDIDIPVIGKPFVTLRGAPGEQTVLLWSAAAGDPTLVTNAMIKAQGAANGKMTTTPTNTASGGVSYYPPGSHAISVTDKGTIAPGDWWVYGGCNDPALVEYGASAGPFLVWQDLLRVQSINALTLRNYQKTSSYHTLTKGASTGTVQIFCQSVDVVQRFALEDLVLDGANMANALLVDYGVDWAVRRCTFRNFARYCVETRYGRGGAFIDNLIDGGVSGILGGDASHDVEYRGTRCTETGERYNAVGRIWGPWVVINDCCNWRIEGNEFVHLGAGGMLFGERNMRHEGNTYRDIDIAEFKIRNTAAADEYTLGVVGAAVHMGVVNLNVAYFNAGWQDNGTQIVDCVSTSDEDCSYWWHDTFMCNITNLSIYNRGRSSYQFIDGQTRYCQGIRTQDQEGQMSGLLTQGVEWAFRHNSSLGVSLNRITLRAAPSTGTVPVIGLYLDNANTHEMRTIAGIEVQSIYFGPTFDGLNSNTVVTDLVLNDTWWSSVCRIGRNRTGGVRGGGDIVAFDKSITTGERACVATNHAQAAGLAAIVNGPGGFGAPIDGWTLYMTLPGHGQVNCDAVVAGVGVDLKVVGGGSFLLSATGGGARAGQNQKYKGAVATGTTISP